jgi:hypothetical protein
MKSRSQRHIELARRGIADSRRREQILDAEDAATLRAQTSVFDLLKEDSAQRERLKTGNSAFQADELSLSESSATDESIDALASDAIN